MEKNIVRLARVGEKYLNKEMEELAFEINGIGKFLGYPKGVDFESKLKKYRLTRDVCIYCGIDPSEYDKRVANVTRYVACPGNNLCGN